MSISFSHAYLTALSLKRVQAPNSGYLWNPAAESGTGTITSATFTEDNALYSINQVTGIGLNFGPITETAITGKAYCEFTLDTQSDNRNYHAFGIIKSTASRSLYDTGGCHNIYSRFPNTVQACGFAYYSAAINNNIDFVTPSQSAYNFGVNDRIGVAVDMDNGKIWYSKNGSWIYGDPAAGTNPSGTFTPDTFYFAFLNYTCQVSGNLQLSARIYPKASVQSYGAPSGFTPYDPT